MDDLWSSLVFSWALVLHHRRQRLFPLRMRKLIMRNMTGGVFIML
jgi:hypothetical protein